MPGFTVVDLTPQCEVRAKAPYEYPLLEKIDGATDLIAVLSSKIWSTPEEFETPISKESCSLDLRWRACGRGAGVVTLRDADKTLSLSLIASGLDRDADQITLQAFVRHAVRELHDTAFEPSFELLELSERPLVATVGLQAPRQFQAQWLFALADRCFAAAYFRYLNLA